MTEWLRFINWMANRVSHDLREFIAIDCSDPRITVQCSRMPGRSTNIRIDFEKLVFRMTENDIFKPECQLALATIMKEVLGDPQGN